MLPAARPTCFLIADISGYTGHLADVELDHAQDILADLIGAVVTALRPNFRLAKLEGDAAFTFASIERIEAPLRARGEAGAERTAALGTSLRDLGEREGELRRVVGGAAEGAAAAERDEGTIGRLRRGPVPPGSGGSWDPSSTRPRPEPTNGTNGSPC